MPQTLQSILESPTPVNLEDVERTLAALDERGEDEEVILSALIWRRRATGQSGVLGTVMHSDCASRVDVLAEHLESVGATEEAEAFRELRSEIPLEDEVVQRGLVDWLETQYEIADKARELDERVEDIAPQIWEFMQERKENLPDVQLKEGRLATLRGLFRSILSSAGET